MVEAREKATQLMEEFYPSEQSDVVDGVSTVNSKLQGRLEQVTSVSG